MTESQNYSPDLAVGQPEVRQHEGIDQIVELLAEVNALAIRLRQTDKIQSSSRSRLAGAEHTVLDIVDRLGPLTVPQIARERSTSRQNIQILIDRLESQGRVEVFGNPGHKRSALVRLTQQGKTWLHTAEQGQNDWLSGIGSNLSGKEVKEATLLLRTVHGLLRGGNQAQSTVRKAASKPAGETQERPTLSWPFEVETEEFPLNLL